MYLVRYQFRPTSIRSMFAGPDVGVGESTSEDRIAQAELTVPGEELDGSRAPGAAGRVEGPQGTDHASAGDCLAGHEVGRGEMIATDGRPTAVWSDPGRIR